MPETARTPCRASQPTALRIAGWLSYRRWSIGRPAPSATTARSRRSRAAASSSTSPPSDRPKPAIRARVDVGPARSQWSRAVDPRLGVVAEPVRVALALAVARVVEREHAVAVAREHPHVRDPRSRLPPEPWLSRTAAPLRDGTYQADSSRPSAVAIRTSWCGDAERRLLDRPARRVRRHEGHRERHDGERGDDRGAGDPADAPCAAASRRAAPRRARGAAIAARPEATSSSPPAIMPTPVTSVQSGPEFTTCSPCETTPKPSGQQAEDDAEHDPRRARDARLRQRPRPGGRRRSRACRGRRVGARRTPGRADGAGRARVPRAGAGAPGARRARAARGGPGADGAFVAMSMPPCC